MNVLVVDTSVWISYFKGNDLPHVELALQEGRVYASPVVVAELLSARLKEQERMKLAEFLEELPLTDSSFGHWCRVGELRSHCARKGLNVSTPDAHIAQCCLDLDGYLVSTDRIFRKLAALAPLRCYPE